MLKKYKITLITVSFILLIIASFFLDSFVFGLIGLIKNPIMDSLMDWITRFISTFVVFFLITSLFLWGERKREWIIPLWISFFAAGIIGYAIKFLVMRPRPFGVELGFLGFPDYSFPSAHAIAAFSAIAILDREYKKIKWFWILFALLVAFSRVYTQVHYFSDVLAGGLLGYAVGYLVMKLEEKYHFFRKPRSAAK